MQNNVLTLDAKNPGADDPGAANPGDTNPGDTNLGDTSPGGEDIPIDIDISGAAADDSETGLTQEGTEETDSWTELAWVRGVLGEDPVHGLWLAAAGIALGAVLAVITGAIVRRLRRKKRAAPALVEVTDEISGSGISVEKLHEQGARSSQQDCFAVSPLEFQDQQGVLAMVADGMGGLSDGDKISQAAVSAALDAFFTAQGTPEQILLELLKQAADAVNRTLGSGGMRSGGTTMVMGLIKDGAFHYLSVGDSRICLYRGGILYQLNREHSFRGELAVRFVNDGASLQEVYNHPKGGGLTSYLGMGEIRYADLPVQPVAVLPGDRFILMCDGVYNALTEQELTTALGAGNGAVAETLRSAIQAKNYANQDNYTAVILEC